MKDELVWFALLGRHMRAGAFVTASDHHMVWFNDVAGEWIGGSAATLIGDDAGALAFWPRPQPWTALADRALAGEPIEDVPVSLATAAGTREVWMTFSALRDGGDARLLTVLRDVTDRVEYERALRESEARFAATFHASPDSITLTRVEDGTFIDVNPAYERLTGWTRGELIGRRAADLGIVVDHEGRARLAEKVLSEGGVRDWPWPIRTRSGELRECEATVFRVDPGEHPAMTALIRDVSSRRQAQRALVESERKFVAMFEASPVPMSFAWASTGGRIEDVNDAWIDAFGYTREEAIGKRGVELGTWSGEVRDAMLGRLGQDGRVTGHEAWFTRKDGSRFLGAVSASLAPLGDDELLLVSMVDITELHELTHALEERVAARTRELEETLDRLKRAQDDLVQAEKLAALGSLVAGVAHELNTPIGNSLTVATSFDAQTQRLREQQSGGALTRSALDAYLASARDAADILSRNLHRASELIASFKQVAADQTSEQRRRFMLDTLIAEVVLTLSPTVRKTAHRIEIDIAPGLELDSLPGPLGQVVTNLVNNALLHAFEGRASGTLRIEGRGLDAARVELSVADDGCGIPVPHLRRIFEPFFTTRLGRGGTGLGLHIVHNTVTGPLGGRIEVRSTVGSGTRFVVTLPRVAPLSPRSRTEDTPPPSLQ